ncbi:UDP binding domain-containing protein, partial [Sphingobium sp.]|uniref:UDP binding domain-containing protein n=1 Tax=Sphingobium sp. TaxID=1912891 RepID=UPI002D097D40
APSRIVETVVQVNDLRKRAMGRKIVKALGGDARGKTVALLGLTFKPNTDDMRDAPSIAIVQALEDAGAKIVAYDPEGMEVAAPMMPGVTMAKDAYEAARDADALVLVTEWDIFRALDLKRLAGSMTGNALVDLRNIYPVAEAADAGFQLARVGGAGN